jgi:hypothetical protein
MRASIAHVVGTAVLVALPALVSAPTHPAAPARAARRAPAPPPPSSRSAIRRPTSTLAWFSRSDGTENPPKYEPKRIKLSDFKGKQNVVVAFFPGRVLARLHQRDEAVPDEPRHVHRANTTMLGVSVDSTVVEPRLPRAARRRSSRS